jgi:hypothetical protein
MRLRLLLVGLPLVLVVALALPSVASAGWAGSRYERSDCTRTNSDDGRPGLYCERWFTDASPNVVQDAVVADEACPSGRLERTSGTLLTRYRGWDYYWGPAPLARFAFVGNEDSFSFSWAPGAVVTDLGCL